MNEDEIDDISEKIDDASTGAEAHSTYVVPKDKSKHLSGMFQNWFLDYASYVILERAVGVILHGASHDVRHFVEATVVEFLHCVQDAPLHGFQTVLDVGHGAFQNHV